MATYTKQQLIEDLMLQEVFAEATKKQVTELVGDLFATIADKVAAGDDVYLGQSFGGFSQVTKASRSGKALGVAYETPERKAIKFKPSAALKHRIAG